MAKIKYTMPKKLQQLQEAIKAYGELKKLYIVKYSLLSEIRDMLKTGKYELVDIVNFVYVFREMSKLADDMRKEADGLIHLCENVCCAMWITINQNQPEKADTIRASLASGTPKINLGVKLPRQKDDPENFNKLVAHFGIPNDLIETKCVKFHWPGICEMISKMAEDGRPLPPGISPENTYPTYSLIIKQFQNLEEFLRKMKGRRAVTWAKHLTQRPKR